MSKGFTEKSEQMKVFLCTVVPLTYRDYIPLWMPETMGSVIMSFDTFSVLSMHRDGIAKLA